MADLPIENAPVKSVSDNQTEATRTGDKQTNKLFEQSEVDRLVAEQVRKATEKYQDYSNVKKGYDQLLKAKEEAELKEKTEIEKKEIEIQKLTGKLSELETKARNYELSQLKSKVLTNSKYAPLPEVYKNNIPLTDNEVDIQKAADDMLEKFKIDFQQQTGKSWGQPDEAKKAAAPDKVDVNALRDKIRSKFKKVAS